MAEIKKGLPGTTAQNMMAPVTRPEQMKGISDFSKARMAAVLILLYPGKNDLMLPFIKRPEYDGVHSGQIAFPGGKSEKSDHDITFTALREAYEETGINPGAVSVIGKLTDLYVPPSNYLVTPVVGFSVKKPAFVTDPLEVAALYQFRLKDILNPGNRRHETLYGAGNRLIRVPCFKTNNQVIWGATAMILAELVQLFEKINLR